MGIMTRLRAVIFLIFCLQLSTQAARQPPPPVSSTGRPLERPQHEHSHINGPNLQQALTEHKIIPDVIKDAPTKILKIEYPDTHKEAQLGNELHPKDIRKAPKVSFPEADPHAFYTLMLVDPDAPNPQHPVNKEWQHWLVGNIPGSELLKGNAAGPGANTIIEYVGSAPPQNGGTHRYAMLLYRQPEKLRFDEPHRSNRDGNRAKFSAEGFAKKYKLEGPVAANFWMAKYDDSVPETHRQFRH